MRLSIFERVWYAPYFCVVIITHICRYACYIFNFFLYVLHTNISIQNYYFFFYNINFIFIDKTKSITWIKYPLRYIFILFFIHNKIIQFYTRLTILKRVLYCIYSRQNESKYIMSYKRCVCAARVRVCVHESFCIYIYIYRSQFISK